MAEKDHHSDRPIGKDDIATDSPVATARPAPETRRKNKPLPLYHVILLDDNDHTHEYVVEMLKVLFAHSEQAGFRMAEEVDRTGRAIVLTTHKEHAELKRDQIHTFGSDQRVATCQGSMSATIEPVDE